MKFCKTSEDCIFLEDIINGSPNFDEIVNDNLRAFRERDCAEFLDFIKILDEVKKVKIKNKNCRIPKVTLQIIGFVYNKIMDFPISDFAI